MSRRCCAEDPGDKGTLLCISAKLIEMIEQKVRKLMRFCPPGKFFVVLLDVRLHLLEDE